MGNFTAWMDDGGEDFRPVADSFDKLPPGLYNTYLTNSGLFVSRQDMSDLEVLRFPGLPIDRVMSELEDFWERSDLFTAHGIPHKRGYLLYGPPGSGKTCTVNLIVQDVIQRGGLVFQFSSSFAVGYSALRDIEPERPLVVTMEDLDSLITPQNESGILNVLDGIARTHKVVFVATTNYPGALKERVTNRPSRFDRKVLVDHPNDPARRMYLEHLLREGDELDLDQWVKDTSGFSLAHLKELFVSVMLLGNPYDESLKTLRGMKTNEDTKFGYQGGQYA